MSRLPSTGPSLLRELRRRERQALRQAQSSAFNLSGTSVTAEGVVTVDGELDINGPLAVHGTAAFDGNTTIGGNAAITGTLSLPAGIIDNAALATPSVSQEVYFSATNFALSTSAATKASTTITVPAGFTKAVVTLVARAIAFNPNTTGGTNSLGADYFRVQPTIGAASGVAMPLSTGGNGGSNINVAPFTDIRTGMTGGSTFVIGIDVWADYLSWAANTSNTVVMSGSITWTR